MSLTCARCGAANRETASFCGNCGQPLPVASATGALAAQTLLNGRYEIIDVIGRGAMGAVYRAQDFQGDRLVAVKEMSDAALGSGQRAKAVEQFRREALLLQALSHPNLVRVTDVFTAERRHYLVMDYIEGQRPPGRLSEVRVREIALELCDALAYLHSRQPPVVFRDLKPENILLVGDTRQVKLIDFGIARLFDPMKDRDTVAIGTRGFMAPEAFHGQTDPRSDLYSLGVTLHTLLTGFNPASNPWQLPEMHTLAADVSEEMAQIVAHAVQLDPDQRFQTANEFKRALGGEVAAVEEASAGQVAGPVAARVSSARPVRFNGREQITRLDQLIHLCETQREAAVNHLRAGDLEVWLDALGEHELARHARELRQQSSTDMNVQLEVWLEATGRVAPPVLRVVPPLLNLGAISNRAPYAACLRLRNESRGFMAGRFQTDVPWLVPEQAGFAGNDEIVRVRILTDRLPPEQTAQGQLWVGSNGGQVVVPVRFLPSPAGRGAAAMQPPRWAAGLLQLLAVAGGVWLVYQLASRWILGGFDMAAWLEGGRSWLLWPLAAAILSLAAMAGSLYQWERLAADAPLAEWGKAALWTLSLTAVTLGLAAAAITYGLPPLTKLLGSPPFLVLSRMKLTLPLIAGGATALAAATGWAAWMRRTPGGTVGFVFLTLGWGILILVGAVAGLWLGGLLNHARKTGLPAGVWWGLVLAGAVLLAALGYLIVRSASRGTGSRR